MTISIDWATRVIYVPKVDSTLVTMTPSEFRRLDLDYFRLALKDLEDSEEGMPFPDTHTHDTEKTIGNLTLAQVILIINNYTITFEDGQYIIELVGANSNVADVLNANSVSVRSLNSAGLIVVSSGGVPEFTVSEIADAVWNELLAEHNLDGSAGKILSETPTADVDAEAIADAVWDEVAIDHTIAGTTGQALAQVCSIGSGNIAWDYLITQPDHITPIPDVTVRVSTDVNGANIIASGITDAFGKVTFYLNPGTYYVWSYKAFVNFVNPDIEVVS